MLNNGKMTAKRYMFFNQMVLSKLQCGACDKRDEVNQLQTRHFNMIHRSCGNNEFHC